MIDIFMLILWGIHAFFFGACFGIATVCFQEYFRQYPMSDDLQVSIIIVITAVLILLMTYFGCGSYPGWCI